MSEATRTERRLGPYTLLEHVGSGGMGEVHIARRDGASTLCVLKQLRERTAGENLFRLKREAHVLSQLTHPNIARLIDAGVDGNAFYLALELIPGQTVRRILRRLAEHQRTFPVEIAIQVALEVLDGLAYAHDQRDPDGRPLQLVHRDLSPNNVMVSYDGRAKIIDFGIASGRLDDFRTTPGMILGTMRYISPEQALSKPVDRRSDLYTLAAVLYEMLTGAPVVDKGEQNEILDAVLRKRPEPFAAPALVRLWPVVAKALDKRASDRFESAGAFKAALLEVSRDLALPSSEDLGRFLASWFPEQQHARMIAPEDVTNSVPADTTDRGGNDHSDTASDEHQLTEIERRPRVLVELPTAPVRAPKKSRKRSIALPMALTFSAAMTALVLAMPQGPPAAPTELPPVVAQPTVVARPADPVTLEPEISAKPARRVPKSITVEQPLVRRPSLRDKLVRLREQPDDLVLLLDLHREIRDRARVLPQSTQDAIQAEVDAAKLSGDIDTMARGLELLERASQEE